MSARSEPRRRFGEFRAIQIEDAKKLDNWK
jgi:hypothetical protein